MKLLDVKSNNFDFLLKSLGDCLLKELFPKGSIEIMTNEKINNWCRSYFKTSSEKDIDNPFRNFYVGFRQTTDLHNATLFWCKYIEILIEFLGTHLLKNKTLPCWNSQNKSSDMVQILQFLSSLFRMVELIAEYGLASDKLDEEWFFGIGATRKKSISLKHKWVMDSNKKDYSIRNFHLDRDIPTVFKDEVMYNKICSAKNLSPNYCDRIFKYANIMVLQEYSFQSIFGNWDKEVNFATNKKLRTDVKMTFELNFECMARSMDNAVKDTRNNLKAFFKRDNFMKSFKLKSFIDSSCKFGHVMDLSTEKKYSLFSEDALALCTNLWAFVTSFIQSNLPPTPAALSAIVSKLSLPKLSPALVPSHSWKNTPKKMQDTPAVIEPVSSCVDESVVLEAPVESKANHIASSALDDTMQCDGESMDVDISNSPLKEKNVPVPSEEELTGEESVSEASVGESSSDDESSSKERISNADKHRVENTYKAMLAVIRRVDAIHSLQLEIVSHERAIGDTLKDSILQGFIADFQRFLDKKTKQKFNIGNYFVVLSK